MRTRQFAMRPSQKTFFGSASTEPTERPGASLAQPCAVGDRAEAEAEEEPVTE